VVYKQVFDGYPVRRTRIEHFSRIKPKGLIPNMATTSTSTTSKPARKSTARKSTGTRATTRRTASKAPAKTRARAARTTAERETREAAAAQTRAAKATAAEGRTVVERAALVYVGATLEARDRVLGLATGLVDRYGSRAAAEREVNKDLRRFERRGTTARNQLERDVRKARTRLERAVRTRRRDAERVLRRNRRAVEREVGVAERDATRRSNIVSTRIADVSNRVEDAAQFGVATGSRLANVAKERVTALV
jgi:hypothetical protein